MRVAIIGGTGYLGNLLVKKHFVERDDLLVVARNEGKLVELREQFPGIKVIPGDIADSWTVREIFKFNPQGVFLLSAFKHVDMAEEEVMRCTQTNVIGLVNILQESLSHKPGFMVLTSTDKAAQVSGVYGATKLLGERLFQEAESLNKDTKYRVVRYGNVWGSTGSFITKWVPKILRNEEITLTDPNATRFFWTSEDAVQLIYDSLDVATDAKPYVPAMKAMRMGDIVVALSNKFGTVHVKVTGLKDGENLHETMDGKVFSSDVERYTVEEIEAFL